MRTDAREVVVTAGANIYTDQPLLYAFFSLALGLAGDLGIAISLATEGTLVRWRLIAQLRGCPNADDVSSIAVNASFNSHSLDHPQES